jgi:hypothetical protein
LDIHSGEEESVEFCCRWPGKGPPLFRVVGEVKLNYQSGREGHGASDRDAGSNNFNAKCHAGREGEGTPYNDVLGQHYGTKRVTFSHIGEKMVYKIFLGLLNIKGGAKKERAENIYHN